MTVPSFDTATATASPNPRGRPPISTAPTPAPALADAMSLLGELYRRGDSAYHATGSASFTKTMRKVAGRKKREVQELFKYFNSFMDAEPNAIDVLICDESHRLRKTSAN